MIRAPPPKKKMSRTRFLALKRKNPSSVKKFHWTGFLKDSFTLFTNVRTHAISLSLTLTQSHKHSHTHTSTHAHPLSLSFTHTLSHSPFPPNRSSMKDKNKNGQFFVLKYYKNATLAKYFNVCENEVFGKARVVCKCWVTKNTDLANIS